jgi:hypothetical protein
MPSEMVPSIGGGRNWILMPVFFRRDGVGDAVAAVGDGVAVGEPAGAGGEETTALTVTDGTDGEGVGDCAMAVAARTTRALRIATMKR